MTDDQPVRQKSQPLGSVSKGKKLYQKPAFRYERVFETLALSCGKLVGTGGQCHQVKKTS
jgi:hypothetical protein